MTPTLREGTGPGHNMATIIFTSSIQGQNVDFRVDIFAGVGMIRASLLFMLISIFVSLFFK